eukprot:scaffold72248_cov17-Tisochrysis_lutea.AAC.1
MLEHSPHAITRLVFIPEQLGGASERCLRTLACSFGRDTYYNGFTLGALPRIHHDGPPLWQASIPVVHKRLPSLLPFHASWEMLGDAEVLR